jgi:hypothetical protein
VPQPACVCNMSFETRFEPFQDIGDQIELAYRHMALQIPLLSLLECKKLGSCVLI